MDLNAGVPAERADERHAGDRIGIAALSFSTPALAGIANEDVFATIDTTQGWLSNGISKPMTINGGVGDDSFIVNCCAPAGSAARISDIG